MSTANKLRIRWDIVRLMWRSPRMLDHTGKPMKGRKWLKTCGCGRQEWIGIYSDLCHGCRAMRFRTMSAIRRKASATVARAIRQGQLPRLGSGCGIRCTDCDSDARVYEHRDYSKPLEVEPVCFSCNLRRGPAIDMAPHIIRWPRHMRANSTQH
jgi:hypothetical protein